MVGEVVEVVLGENVCVMAEIKQYGAAEKSRENGQLCLDHTSSKYTVKHCISG